MKLKKYPCQFSTQGVYCTKGHKFNKIIINKMKRQYKVFIGGLTIGVIVGALIGAFSVAAVLCTAFINWGLTLN